MFAGGVEVELLERIRGLERGYPAAILRGELNRVSIIGDFKRLWLPVDFDAVEIGLDGTRQINGRLLASNGTSLELAVNLAPILPRRASPMRRSFLRQRCRGTGRASDQRLEKSSTTLPTVETEHPAMEMPPRIGSLQIISARAKLCIKAVLT